MTSKEKLHAKRECAAHYDEYVAELRRVTDGIVVEENLVSLEETLCVSDLAKNGEQALSYRNSVRFDQKHVLKECISRLASVATNPCYLYTSYSRVCGALRLERITQFNHDFSFDSEHAGIIAIVDSVLYDRMVLDFYEEEIPMLCIEIYGSSWGTAVQ